MVASCSGVVLGNNQRTIGPMIRDVLLAEKLLDEATEMKISQSKRGTYRLRNLASDCFAMGQHVSSAVARGSSTSDDLDARGDPCAAALRY